METTRVAVEIARLVVETARWSAEIAGGAMGIVRVRMGMGRRAGVGRMAGVNMVAIAMLVGATMLVGTVRGQDCPRLPAPCPFDGDIEANKDVAMRTQDNALFPEDIRLEDRLREAVTAELGRVGGKMGWDLYELSEQGIGNPYIFISGYDWNTCPFDRRPPHRFRISFVLITNRDSFELWKNWTATELQQKTDELIQQYQRDNGEGGSGGALRQYQDSLQFYMKAYGDFLQGTQAAYLKDLQDNNQKAVEAHDRKAKAILANSDRIQKEMEAVQNGSRSTKASNTFTNYADNETCRFAESSIALVTFDFNPYQTDRGMDGDAETLSESPLTIPPASFATLIANHVPPKRNNYRPNYNGFAFENPSCGAMVLFGSFQPRDKEYSTYRCTYAKNYHDSKSTIGDVKAVPEDKIQNISIHIQGRKDKVKSILGLLNWTTIDQLLYKP